MLGRNIQTFHFIYIHIFWRRSNNKATRSKVILHTTIRKATCRQHFIEKTVFQGRKKFFFLFFFCSSKRNPFFEQKKEKRKKLFHKFSLLILKIYGNLWEMCVSFGRRKGKRSRCMCNNEKYIDWFLYFLIGEKHLWEHLFALIWHNNVYWENWMLFYLHCN